MAIFISRYPRYQFTLATERVLERHPASGEVLRRKPAEHAEFLPVGRAPFWVLDAVSTGLHGTSGVRPVYEREIEEPGEDAAGKTPMDRPVAQDIAPVRLPFRIDDPSELNKLGWFDSEITAADRGWTDEDHAEYVEKMRRFSGPDSFIEVVAPKLAPPWPTYGTLVARGKRTNEKVAAEIVRVVDATGISRQLVAAYERENLNRPEVLAALEAAPVVEEPEEELVEA